MKKQAVSIAKLCLRLVMSLMILAWLLSRIDLSQLTSALCSISLFSWSSAFLLYLCSQLISSMRWHVISHGLDFPGNLSTYIKYYFVGMFFNLFLPSAIGGDVFKIFFLSKGGGSRLRAGYSIFMDRAFGLWSMFIIGSVALYLYPTPLEERWRMTIMLVAIVLCILVGCAPLLQGLLKKVCKGSSQHNEKETLLKRLISYIDVMLFFWKRPQVLFKAFSLSLILQFFSMSAVFVLGKGLGIEAALPFYLGVLPVIFLITILPISMSGIGVREGGFVYFFTLAGVPMEKALSLSLAFFTIQALCALLGGFGYIAGVHKQVIYDQ